MLEDEHLKVCYYEQDASKLFPNTMIKGGVAITLRDEARVFGAIGTFTMYTELNCIQKKVTSFIGFRPISEIIFSPYNYNFTKLMHEENSFAKERMSEGTEYSLRTSVFKTLPEIFFESKPVDGIEYAKILGLENGKRVEKYIRRSYVQNNNNFDKYKVFLPESNGNGTLGETLSNPVVQGPGVGATQTFISFGQFDTEIEAISTLKYLKTKFVRALLSILKATQHNTAVVWQKVPLQDFTSNSDIDWTKSIKEIDQQLYKKYGLSDEEITFIETNVKPME